MTMRFDAAYYRFLAVAAVAIAGCSPEHALGTNDRASRLSGPSADVATLTSTPVLFNQSSVDDNEGFNSETDTTYFADDFVVPAGTVWTVTEIGVTAALHYGELPFSIRVDEGGHPGALVQNTTKLSLSPTKVGPIGIAGYDFLFTLPGPVVLSAGKYWLTIESSTPEGFGTVLWQMHTQSNAAAVVSLDNGATWGSVGHDYSFGVFGTSKLTQSITLAPVTPNPAPLGSTATVNASASSGLTVALAAGPSNVCTLSGTTVSFVGLGTCTVSANQAGNATYSAAAEVTQDVAVSTLSQTITFPNITPNPATVSSTATLGATASSGLEVRYSTLTQTICTVSGNTLSYVAAGICIVAADQFGNGTYDVAPTATQNVTVEKIRQTITFTSTPPAPGYVNGTYTVAATGGASGNPVVITSTTPNVCTVAGTVVRFVGVGTCVIAANQSGNSAYNAAPQVMQSVKVDYRFTGFADPVKNDGTLNTAKAGKAIALTWRVTDAAGAPVLTLTTAVISVKELSCSVGGADNLLDETTAGGSGLQNLGDGYYQLNWKTPASYARSCKTLHLDLGEGSGTRTASFAFTK